MSHLAERLKERGILLPPPSTPIAAYVPFVVEGNLVFISGQLPMENGAVKFAGRVGAELDLATGQAAARLCGLHILSQLLAACGDLGRVKRCVKLGGFVASTPDFYDQPKVINGASELMQDVFGEAGRHARFAVGIANLPFNAAVEVDALFSL